MNKPYVLKGALAAIAILVLYASLVSVISSPAYLQGQLSKFWYYIGLLAAGFGVQAGLYSYLKTLHCRHMPKGALTISSTSSALAMLACCAHYLITILPVFGIMGFVAFVYRFQIQLFWVGLLFSAIGIANMLRQVRLLKLTTSI